MMAIETSTLFAKLKARLAHIQAKFYQPDLSDYKQVEQCFIEKPVKTLGIVKPQNTVEVAAILQFCLKNNVEFSVRSGGHDCAARTLVNGTIVIDMRDINQVVISKDKHSAKVGGGIKMGELANVLGEEGLATPV
jgi:FAD/FMN-containing dehydrogenase